MTRITNARIAGVAFLTYIAAGINDMVIHGHATSGYTVGERLATIAQHSSDIRTIVLLEMVQCFCALVLGITLWSITREVDADIATMGMISRVVEGVLVALAIPETLSLQWLATAHGANAPDPTTAQAIAAYLFGGGGGVAFTATFFAFGSSLFAWLLLRGRLIPAVLAWLGVIASVLLVIVLPLQLAGYVAGPITRWIWIPMFFFEVPLALWFLIKGVAPVRS